MAESLSLLARRCCSDTSTCTWRVCPSCVFPIPNFTCGSMFVTTRVWLPSISRPSWCPAGWYRVLAGWPTNPLSPPTFAIRSPRLRRTRTSGGGRWSAMCPCVCRLAWRHRRSPPVHPWEVGSELSTTFACDPVAMSWRRVACIRCRHPSARYPFGPCGSPWRIRAFWLDVCG